MSQSETLQDIYSKIADIYDKFCNLDSEPITQLVSGVLVNENSWDVPTISFDNPTNDSDISAVQQEVNDVLGLAFSLTQTEENTYYQAIGDGSILPVPSASPLVWLPKLISILVGYQAPLRILASLIIDFIKEIILEEIKRRINQKTNYFVGSIIANTPTRFDIPYNADKVIVICSNIPEWKGKRFDRVYYGENDKFAPSLATVSFGLTSQYTGQIFWTNDTKVEYKSQLIDIPNLKNLTNLKGYIYLEDGIQAQIIFVQFI